ncbi:hypothetical protein [Flexivirga lutea]
MSRKKKDPVTAVPRYLSGTRAVRRGLELQRERILAAGTDAPLLLEGTPAEVVNFTDVPANDLWYHVYELGRLRDLTSTVANFFDEATLRDALTELDAQIPDLHEARNRWTHVVNDEYLDFVVNFDSIVRLTPGQRPVYLIDPRYRHHDAALACLEVLEGYLREQLRLQIQTAPPRPLTQQVAERKAEADASP